LLWEAPKKNLFRVRQIPQTRRSFCRQIVSSAAVLAAAARTSDAEPAGAARKFVLGAPLTHSDWMLKSGVAWGEEGVRHMLDACKAVGWSRIYWRVFDGGRSLYRSKLMKAQGKWDDGGFWDPQTAEDKAMQERFTAGMSPEGRKALRDKLYALDYEHFDSFAAAIEYGHRIGLEIHAWATVNEDDHGWGIQSEYSKQHPEYRWKKRDGRSYRSQLSFGFPAVREYKLALLQELLGYDLDGFFLDWIRTGDVRDNPQTDGAGVLDSGYEEPLVAEFQKKHASDPHLVENGDERWVRIRAEPQTEFMRAAQQLIRNKKPGLPIAAMVAHPWLYRGNQDKIDGNLRGLLLDVPAWAREGLVDAVVAAGYYRDGGNSETAWRALQRETEGKVDVWTYAWVPKTAAEVDQLFAVAEKVEAKQVLFWEADYIDDRANAAELGKMLKERARGSA